MGCKVQRLSMVYQRKREFYLDYVGCKDDTWEKLKIKQSRFYLDYVGCKVIKTKLAVNHSRTCFISTMWDVKVSLPAKRGWGYHVLSRLCGM